VLKLHGIPGENGTYACRLNNSRHETFKYFMVEFAEDQLSTIIISVFILSAVVLIAAIGISIKLYRDKVYNQVNISL
jgi:hypothetical protein